MVTTRPAKGYPHAIDSDIECYPIVYSCNIAHLPCAPDAVFVDVHTNQKNTTVEATIIKVHSSTFQGL